MTERPMYESPDGMSQLYALGDGAKSPLDLFQEVRAALPERWRANYDFPSLALNVHCVSLDAKEGRIPWPNSHADWVAACVKESTANLEKSETPEGKALFRKFLEQQSSQR